MDEAESAASNSSRQQQNKLRGHDWLHHPCRILIADATFVLRSVHHLTPTRFPGSAVKGKSPARGRAFFVDSPLKEVAKCSQRPNTIADDLSNSEHGHGEDSARNTPYPEPEDERDNDENGIEGEPSGQKHRRYTLALDQMKSKVKPRRKQRLPERVMGQQASEKKDQHP